MWGLWVNYGLVTEFQGMGLVKELGLVRNVLVFFAIAVCRAKEGLAVALSPILGIFWDHGLLLEEW